MITRGLCSLMKFYECTKLLSYITCPLFTPGVTGMRCSVCSCVLIPSRFFALTSLRLLFLLASGLAVVVCVDTWRNKIWPEIRGATSSLNGSLYISILFFFPPLL